MPPTLRNKLDIKRGGKLPTRSSPRKGLKKPADGMTWIDVRASEKVNEDDVGITKKQPAVNVSRISEVPQQGGKSIAGKAKSLHAPTPAVHDSISEVPQQAGQSVAGKAKSIRAPTLPTRFSPRKRACVRLFDHTSAVDDGRSTDDLCGGRRQHEDVTGREKCNETKNTKNQGTMRRSRATLLRTRTSAWQRASARLNTDFTEPIAGAGESEADFTGLDLQQISPLHAHHPPESINNKDGDAEQANDQNEAGSSLNENVTAPTVEGSKKCCTTRGVSYAKCTTTKGKMAVTAAPHLMRFVGRYSTQFVTEIGVIIRCNAPLHVISWSDINSAAKTTMIGILQESFEFNDDKSTMSALDAQMRRSFRSWKYRMYEKVKKCTNVEDIPAMKPSHMLDAEWTVFVNHIRSQEFQKRSNTNKTNRQAQRIKHAVGSKSVARTIFEKKNQEAETNEGEVDKIQLFHDMHFSKKKNEWVDEGARRIYENLVAARESSSLSVDEIFDLVLPSRSAMFRGIGVLPRSKKMQVAQEMEAVRQDAESSKAKEKEANMKCQYLEDRLAEMEHRVAVLEGKQSKSLPTEAGTANSNDIDHVDTGSQG